MMLSSQLIKLLGAILIREKLNSFQIEIAFYRIYFTNSLLRGQCDS